MKPKFEDIFNNKDDRILLGIGEYVLYCTRSGSVRWIFDERGECYYPLSDFPLREIYEERIDIEICFKHFSFLSFPISQDYLDGVNALRNMSDSEKLMLPKWYKDYIIMESLKR